MQAQEKSSKTEESLLLLKSNDTIIFDNKDSTNCIIVTDYSCKVMCYGVIDQDIADIVNQLNFSQCTASDIRLQLPNIVFTNGNIIKGWLKNIVKNIIHLDISSEYLKTIGEEAFAEQPFTFLQKLEIRDSNLVSLTKNIFLNSRIQILAVRNEEDFIDEHNFVVELDALEHIAKDLTTLTFVETLGDPQAIINLTGPDTTVFEKLTIIDMRENRISYLYDNSFVSAVKLKTLFLSNSHIHEIEVNAFSTIAKTLTTLTLDCNELSTFKEGVFNGFTGAGEINVNDNPLECDCNLLWFKKFYEANRHTYFEESLKCKGGIDYTLIEFCPSTTTDLSSTTEKTSTLTTDSENSDTTSSTIADTAATTTTTITTSYIPTTSTTSTSEKLLTTPSSTITSTVSSTASETTTDIILLNSTVTTTSVVISQMSTDSTSSSVSSTLNHSNRSSVVTTNFPLSTNHENYHMACTAASQRNYNYRTNNRIFIDDAAVRNNSIVIEFYSIDSTPCIELKIHEIEGGENLIWISSSDQNVYGCVSEIYDTVELDNLSYEHVYIICLIKPVTKTINPFDCTSFRTPSNWGSTPWIFNKDKLWVIGSVITINIFIILVSCCSSIYCMKKHHGHIKSEQIEYNQNKNLIVQKQQYAVSSASKDDGYVSPIARKLSTISEKEFEGSFRRKKSCDGELYEHFTPPLDNISIDKHENLNPFASSSAII